MRRITACLLLAFGTVTATFADQPMTLSDVMALEYAADPRFFPDGERIVYVRTSADPMTDRFRGALWLLSPDGEDTLLVRVPEAPHGIARRPSHLMAKVASFLAWFARYGAPSAAPPVESGRM